MDGAKTLLQILALLIVVVVIAYNIHLGLIVQEINIPGLASIVFGHWQPTTEPKATPSVAATTRPVAEITPPPPKDPPGPISSGASATPGCIVTITNRLVALRSEPSAFSRELVRVRPGDYATLQQQLVDFGGLEQQSWLQIEAEGRKGWIENNTWTLAGKSRACP